jgi:hypothetical protein
MERSNRFNEIIYLLLVVILLNCGCITPSDNHKESTDITVETTALFEKNTDLTTTIPEKDDGKTTLKKSWEILSTKSEVDDLKFYAYIAEDMDNTGKAYNYRLFGYSPTQDRLYAIGSNMDGMNYSTQDNPPLDKYYDIDEIKDSPQIIEDAIKVKGGCSNVIRLTVSADNARAEIWCRSNEWAINDYEYLIENNTN